MRSPSCRGDANWSSRRLKPRRAQAEIEATLALYEELLRRAEDDDLMAADVRAEIQGGRDAG